MTDETTSTTERPDTERGRSDTEARSPERDGGEPPAADGRGETRTYRVSGMHCASCAQSVEKALGQVEGVRSAAVNFATESAAVEVDDPGRADDPALRKAVEDAGYELEGETRTTTLEIGGMHCASCAQSVEKALRGIEGVASATVNFASETAAVEYDASEAGPDAFRAAVEEAGYQVAGISGERTESRADRERRKLEEDQRQVDEAKGRMWWAWALTAPIVAWMLPEMIVGVKWPTELAYDAGMILLAAPILLIWGRQTLVGGFRSLSPGRSRATR
jgi:Cu+-exporting ATPase